MTTLFECDMDDARMAEKGVVFACPNRRCPLHVVCPYAARTCNEKGETDGSRQQ